MRLFCPALVGRSAESGAVTGQLAAVATGAGSSVFLLGTAGMGKTRLAREVERDALERGMLVMRGRAAPSVQYRPLTEALLGVLRRTGLPEAPELVPYRAALSRLAPDWGMTRVSGIDDSPIVLAEAVLRLLTRLAGDRGCLLVLEDLHDADADTLMIVEYLVDNVAQEPVMLIGTARPGGDAATMSYAAEQRRNAVVLRLESLNADAVREMVAACLGVPAAAVPQDAMDQLLPASAGVPFFVEELLSAMVDEGLLVRREGRWHSTGVARLPISEAVRASVLARVQRLDPPGRQVVQLAAVYGQPCPAALLATATGLEPTALSDALQISVDTQLLVLDDRADRYRIQHALVGEVLRAANLPDDRAGLSRRAAAAIERTFPGLPADWCVLAGTLWQQAGEPERAAELFHRAGRRAAEQGAVRTAIALLEQGLTQLDGVRSASTAQLVEALLELLVVAGELPRARELGARLDPHVPPQQRAGVHLRLARAAVAAGQWESGRRELSRVRALAHHDLGDAAESAADVVAAQLAVADRSPDRLHHAEALAHRALRAADRVPLPDIACEALEVLGCCARVLDLDRSDVLFSRGLNLAEQHGLTLWRIRFLLHLGAHAAIRHADPSGLIEARDTALKAGAVITALDGDAELAVLHLTRGEYDTADRVARHCEQSAHRLGLAELRLIAWGLRVCTAAHRADRTGVTELLTTYDQLGGRRSDFTSALKGLGLAFCSLLEEDRARALAELGEAAAEEAHRPPEYLSLVHGPHLAIAVLAGQAGWTEHNALAHSARGQAGWNRQFVLLAGAVLAGREDRHAVADREMAVFEEVATPYPLGKHLGLRLAGEAAIMDGWGRPGPWLRAAEEYFHAAGIPRVTAACRALLRRAGEPAPQRRANTEAVPATLRRVGVTGREYEVLALLADRLTNQEIGERLFVSPRTVETHVARLLAKTGLADRAALARHATSGPAAAGAGSAERGGTQ